LGTLASHFGLFFSPPPNLARLPSSADPKNLPRLAQPIAQAPKGARPTIGARLLAQKLTGQIESASKLTGGGFYKLVPTSTLRKHFKKGLLDSLKTVTGRQNLVLGSYCPDPVGLILGFGKLVRSGIILDGKKVYFTEFKDARMFTRVIVKKCGILPGFQEFYKVMKKQ